MGKIKLTILMLVCFGLMVNVSVMAYNVGVKGGDSMKYYVKETYSGQGQNINYAGTVEIDIETVTSTQITGTLRSYGGSLPVQNTSFSIDTQTWSSSSSTVGTTFLIPSGLKVNDSIPGVGTVKSIGDWNGRKAVVTTASSTLNANAYYDQETGVFLEASGSVSGGSVSVKLVDTSLFSIETGKILGLDLIIWIVIIVVVVAAVIFGAFLFIRKGRKMPIPPIQTAPPTPPPP